MKKKKLIIPIGILIIAVIAIATFILLLPAEVSEKNFSVAFGNARINKTVLVESSKHTEIVGVQNAAGFSLISIVPKSIASKASDIQKVSSKARIVVWEGDPIFRVSDSSGNFSVTFQFKGANENYCTINVLLPDSYLDSLTSRQRQELNDALVPYGELGADCEKVNQLEKELATKFRGIFITAKVEAKPSARNFFFAPINPYSQEQHKSVIDVLNETIKSPEPIQISPDLHSNVLDVLKNTLLGSVQPTAPDIGIQITFADKPPTELDELELLQTVYAPPKRIDLSLSNNIRGTFYSFFSTAQKKAAGLTEAQALLKQKPEAKISFQNAPFLNATATVEGDSAPFTVKVFVENPDSVTDWSAVKKLDGELELDYKLFMIQPIKIPVSVWFNPCKQIAMEESSGDDFYKALVYCWGQETGAQRKNFDEVYVKDLDSANTELEKFAEENKVRFANLRRAKDVIQGVQGVEYKDIDSEAKTRLQAQGYTIEIDSEGLLFENNEKLKAILQRVENAGQGEAENVSSSFENLGFLYSELIPLVHNTDFSNALALGSQLNALAQKKWQAELALMRNPYEKQAREGFVKAASDLEEFVQKNNLASESSQESSASSESNPAPSYSDLKSQFSTGRTFFLNYSSFDSKDFFEWANFKEFSSGKEESPLALQLSDSIIIVNSNLQPVVVLKDIKPIIATEGDFLTANVLVRNSKTNSLESNGEITWNSSLDSPDSSKEIQTGIGATSSGKITIKPYFWRNENNKIVLGKIRVSFDKDYKSASSGSTGTLSRKEIEDKIRIGIEQQYGSSEATIQVLEKRLESVQQAKTEIEKQIKDISDPDSWFVSWFYGGLLKAGYFPIKFFREKTLGGKEIVQPSKEEILDELNSKDFELKRNEAVLQFVIRNLKEGKSLQTIYKEAFAKQITSSSDIELWLQESFNSDPVLRKEWRQQAVRISRAVPDWASAGYYTDLSSSLENEQYTLMGLELVAEKKLDEVTGKDISKNTKLGWIGEIVKDVSSESTAQEFVNFSIVRSARGIIDSAQGNATKLSDLGGEFKAERAGIGELLKQLRLNKTLLDIYQENKKNSGTKLEDKRLTAAFRNPVVYAMLVQEQESLNETPNALLMQENQANQLFDLGYRAALLGLNSEAGGYFFEIAKNYPNSSVAEEAKRLNGKMQAEMIKEGLSSVAEQVFSLQMAYDFLAPTLVFNVASGIVKSVAILRAPIRDIIKPFNATEAGVQTGLFETSQTLKALPRSSPEAAAAKAIKEPSFLKRVWTGIYTNKYLNMPLDDLVAQPALAYRNAQIASKLGLTSNFISTLEQFQVIGKASASDVQLLNSTKNTRMFSAAGNDFKAIDAGDYFLYSNGKTFVIRLPKDSETLQSLLQQSRKAQKAFDWFDSKAAEGSITKAQAQIGSKASETITAMAEDALKAMQEQEKLVQGTTQIAIPVAEELQIAGNEEALLQLSNALGEYGIPNASTPFARLLIVLSPADFSQVVSAAVNSTGYETRLSTLTIRNIPEEFAGPLEVDAPVLLGFGDSLHYDFPVVSKTIVMDLGKGQETFVLPGLKPTTYSSLYGDQAGLIEHIRNTLRAFPIARNFTRIAPEKELLGLFSPPQSIDYRQLAAVCKEIGPAGGCYLGAKHAVQLGLDKRVILTKLFSPEQLKLELEFWGRGRVGDAAALENLKLDETYTAVHEMVHALQEKDKVWLAERFRFLTAAIKNPELDPTIRPMLDSLNENPAYSSQSLGDKLSEFDAYKLMLASKILNEGKYTPSPNLAFIKISDNDIEAWLKGKWINPEEAKALLNNYPELLQNGTIVITGKADLSSVYGAAVPSETSGGFFGKLKKVLLGSEGKVTKAQCSCIVEIPLAERGARVEFKPFGEEVALAQAEFNSGLSLVTVNTTSSEEPLRVVLGNIAEDESFAARTVSFQDIVSASKPMSVKISGNELIQISDFDPDVAEVIVFSQVDPKSNLLVSQDSIAILFDSRLGGASAIRIYTPDFKRTRVVLEQASEDEYPFLEGFDDESDFSILPDGFDSLPSEQRIGLLKDLLQDTRLNIPSAAIPEFPGSSIGAAIGERQKAVLQKMFEIARERAMKQNRTIAHYIEKNSALIVAGSIARSNSVFGEVSPLTDFDYGILMIDDSGQIADLEADAKLKQAKGMIASEFKKVAAELGLNMDNNPELALLRTGPLIWSHANMVLDTRVLAGNPAAVNAINQKQDTILGNSFYEKADQADKEILMKDKLFEEFNVKDNKREIENFIWRMRIRYGIRESNVFEVLYILTQRGIISADEALQLKKSHSAFTNLKIQIDYVKQSLPQSELDSIVAIYGKLDFEHGSAAAFEEWLFKQAGFNDPEEFEAFYMDLVNKTRNTINSIDSRVGEPK